MIQSTQRFGAGVPLVSLETAPWPFPDRSLTYTASGSAAIEAAFHDAELANGRILLPAFICTGAFRSILSAYDAEPVFVDVDPDTFHIDLDGARPLLDTVDAVILDHAFGQPAPADEWRDACDRANVVLIEDCARALGTPYGDTRVGAFGDYAIFSFAKTTPLHGGGAILHDGSALPMTNGQISIDTFVRSLYHVLPGNERLGDQAIEAYQQLANDSDGGRSTHTGTGQTSRGLDQLTRWRFERYRRHRFRSDLAAMRTVSRVLTATLDHWGWTTQRSLTAQTVTVQSLAPNHREGLIETLRGRGFPVHAVWREPWGLDHGEFPVTRALAERVMTFRLREWDLEMLERFAAELPEILGAAGVRPSVALPS